MIRKKQSKVSNDQSVFGHLGELRIRILFIVIFFVAALIVSFVFVGNIYNFLVLPAQGQKLTVLGPGDVVSVYFMIAGFAALAVTTPFLLWQLWLFVAPGLREQERRYAFRLIAPVFIMFLVGASFGYFVVFPEIYHFLKQLALFHYDFMITATEYFGFLFNVVLPFAIVFELPVVVLFLTRIGLLTPKWMRKVRRYAYFVCIVLGTLISPPELISHLSVTVPMILLYEVSIGLSALAYRKKQRGDVMASSTTVDSQEVAVSAQTKVADPVIEPLPVAEDKIVENVTDRASGAQSRVIAPRKGIDLEERE